MINSIFAQIEALTYILNNPSISPIKPNLDLIKSQIEALYTRLDNLCDGMGIP